MSNPTIFSSHDHKACINEAIAKAQAICSKRKVRLTATRLQVLRYIWESHKPAGAYELLARINEEGRKAAPPTVYRALDFLLDLGLIHRIASLNAYIGCICPEQGHQGSFLICQQCHSAQEVPQQDITAAIRQAASNKKFLVQGITLEVSGLCPQCQELA